MFKIHEGVGRPQPSLYLFAGNHFTRLLNQDGKDAKRLARQSDADFRPAVQLYALLVPVFCKDSYKTQADSPPQGPDTAQFFVYASDAGRLPDSTWDTRRVRTRADGR